MNTEKETWMDNVLTSMEGSQRAKPHPQLFAKIEKDLFAPEAKVISMYQKRIAIAAAVLLLSINILTFREYTKNNKSITNKLIIASPSSDILISNYNLYE